MESTGHSTVLLDLLGIRVATPAKFFRGYVPALLVFQRLAAPTDFPNWSNHLPLTALVKPPCQWLEKIAKRSNEPLLFELEDPNDASVVYLLANSRQHDCHGNDYFALFKLSLNQAFEGHPSALLTYIQRAKRASAALLSKCRRLGCTAKTPAKSSACVLCGVVQQNIMVLPCAHLMGCKTCASSLLGIDWFEQARLDGVFCILCKAPVESAKELTNM